MNNFVRMFLVLSFFVFSFAKQAFSEEASYQVNYLDTDTGESVLLPDNAGNINNAINIDSYNFQFTVIFNNVISIRHGVTLWEDSSPRTKLVEMPFVPLSMKTVTIINIGANNLEVDLGTPFSDSYSRYHLVPPTATPSSDVRLYSIELDIPVFYMFSSSPHLIHTSSRVYFKIHPSKCRNEIPKPTVKLKCNNEDCDLKNVFLNNLKFDWEITPERFCSETYTLFNGEEIGPDKFYLALDDKEILREGAVRSVSLDDFGIKVLEKNKKYTFSVVACNSADLCSETTVVEFKTEKTGDSACLRKPDAPEITSENLVGDGSIKVESGDFCASTAEVTVRGTKLRGEAEYFKRTNFFPEIYNANLEYNETTYGKIVSGKKYKIQARACNDVGCSKKVYKTVVGLSDISDCNGFRPKKVFLKKPSNKAVLSKKGNVKFEWKKEGTSGKDSCLYYDANLVATKSKDAKTSAKISLSKLKSGKTYTWKVRACNKYYKGNDKVKCSSWSSSKFKVN